VDIKYTSQNEVLKGVHPVVEGSDGLCSEYSIMIANAIGDKESFLNCLSTLKLLSD